MEVSMSILSLPFMEFIVKLISKIFEEIVVENCPEILLLNYSKTVLSILEIQYQFNIITAVYLIRKKCKHFQLVIDVTAPQHSACYENITK